MKIEIVRMNKNHIDMVMEVENSSFTMPWSKQSFLDELLNPLSYYVVAIENDLVLGYGGLWAILDEGHITNIAVHKNFRKNGIASTILLKIIEFAVENGLSFLTLEVRKSNAPAISLYKKYGFFDVAIRKGYYQDNNEDALIMTKQLI